MNQSIKILVVDKYPFILEAISDLLNKEKDFQVIAKVKDREKALSKINKFKPDVIVIDPFLEDKNGIDFIKKVKAIHETSIKIVIFTNYLCNELIRNSYKIGIHAFLSKREPFEKVINAIRQSYLGNVLVPNQLLNLDNSNHYLTLSEIKILHLMSQEKSNQEIAQDLHISKRTVEHHITSIYQKLNVHSRVGAVLKGMEMGILYL